MTKYVAFFLGTLPLLGIVSCSRPSDLPALVFCEITVINGGTPLDQVRVSMKDESSTKNWSIHGTTNAGGVAKMKTIYMQYTGSGVPAGQYKVAIDKEPNNMIPQPVIDDNMSRQEAERLAKEWNAKYDKIRIVPKEWTFLSSTPFTIGVGTGLKGKLTIDISEHQK